MKSIFDKVSYECSKHTTKMYSTSFSLGIKVLNKKLHKPIYNIYGFVRLADEIVDTFHDYDKIKLFNRFKEDTIHAINEKINVMFKKFSQLYEIELQDMLSFVLNDSGEKYFFISNTKEGKKRIMFSRENLLNLDSLRSLPFSVDIILGFNPIEPRADPSSSFSTFRSSLFEG